MRRAWSLLARTSTVEQFICLLDDADIPPTGDDSERGEVDVARAKTVSSRIRPGSGCIEKSRHAGGSARREIDNPRSIVYNASSTAGTSDRTQVCGQFLRGLELRCCIAGAQCRSTIRARGRIFTVSRRPGNVVPSAFPVADRVGGRARGGPAPPARAPGVSATRRSRADGPLG